MGRSGKKAVAIFPPAGLFRTISGFKTFNEKTRFKARAEREVQPQEYTWYFED
jgi:hypothetical protein